MTAASCPQVRGKKFFHLDVRKEILRQGFFCCSETFQSVALTISGNEILVGCASACFAPVSCQWGAVRENCPIPWLWALLPWGICMSQLSCSIFHVCIRIRLSKVVFVIQTNRVSCDSVFRKSSLWGPGWVEGPYRNCCTHMTRPGSWWSSLSSCRALGRISVPPSHQALAVTLACSPPAGLERAMDG